MLRERLGEPALAERHAAGGTMPSVGLREVKLGETGSFFTRLARTGCSLAASIIQSTERQN